MKKLLAILLCACMILSLAACGGKEEEAPAPEDTKTPEEAVQSGEAKIAETLVIGYDNDLDSADPYGSTSSQCAWYTNATFRTLVKSDYDTGELVGVLAESWNDVNGDATIWELKLLEGVKFHDGSTLDAEDVKFTWEYAKDAANVVKPIASADDMVKEVIAVDDQTVQFVLNYAIPDFISYLEIKIYSKDAFDSMDPAEAGLIGCGPYKVGELVSGVSYALERFDDYYEGTEQFPTKTIVCKAFSDNNSAVAALQAGEISYCFRLPAASYRTLDSDSKVNLVTRPGVMSYYIGINHRKAVWQDVDMRLALAKAINRDDIINVVFEGGITASRSDNFCIASGKGHDASVKAPAYDVDGAKALLEKCGKVGQEVKIMATASAGSKDMGEVVQANLNAAGFNATIDLVDGTNWTELKKTGDYDIFVGDYCSYSGALLYNFNRFFSDGGTSNMFDFHSDEFMEAIDKVRACATYDEMVAEFSNLQVWVAENVPLIPVAVNTAFAGARTNVGGIKLAPSDNLQEVCYLYATE
ncbi:MAG: ABC transporter substrate-binding protein [Oscillibacter sp.]|nr:ABC transporter substrate-binding protein [Oscillibacter sp.]